MDDEPFLRGELVTLRQFESAAQPLGRIVSVMPESDQVEVAWHKRGGHQHEVTVEAVEMLRRVHESEMDPDER
jgi:hypothetical protein